MSLSSSIQKHNSHVLSYNTYMSSLLQRPTNYPHDNSSSNIALSMTDTSLTLSFHNTNQTQPLLESGRPMLT